MAINYTITFNKKIINHHLTGYVSILNNTQTNQPEKLLFKIKDYRLSKYHVIMYDIQKIEGINQYDRKLYLGSVQYNTDVPEYILSMFESLNLLKSNTIVFIKYDSNNLIWYLKNSGMTTAFIIASQ